MGSGGEDHPPFDLPATHPLVKPSSIACIRLRATRTARSLLGPRRRLSLKQRPPRSDPSRMRKSAALLLVALAAAGCGGDGLSAGGAEQYLRKAGPFAEAHCLPGTDGWKYLCTVRRARRLYEVAVKTDGKRVKETTGLLPVGSALPGSPEAAADAFLARASAICSRRMTLVAAIPPPRNLYAAYRFMGAYVQAEREEATSLRRLDPPSDRAEGIRHLISASGRAAAAAESYRAALLRRDRHGVALALAARAQAAADEARAAEELGLRCVAVTP